MKSKRIDQHEYKSITCPSCSSDKVKKDGHRKTLSRGLIQRYKCKKCSYKFTEKDAFFRMRNNPKKITLCIDLFFRGISTRKIQEHLQAFYPRNSDNSTIYRWVIRYAELISEFTDNLKVSTGTEIQVDEVEFHRRKHPQKKLGVAKNWFIDSIDTKTRFAVASNYIEERSTENIKTVMRSIKNKSKNVEIITTDGFMAYENVVKKTFGYSNKLKRYKIFHNQVIASKGEGFNYPIERLHNNIRARTKTMRGFHGSVYSARAIMRGMMIYYNFITQHQGIGCAPYKLATELELGVNKWLDLIELSYGSTFKKNRYA